MSRPSLTRLLLALGLVVLGVRLAGFVATFARESLQADFAAFYTAGRAAGAGLDPYRNQVDTRPPIWDGAGGFRHSRFLYPPLTARLFQPLAALPYGAAKLVWSIATLLLLGAALATWTRLAAPRLGLDGMLAVGVAAAAFYPVLALLERGQTDALTLLLLGLGLGLARRPRRELAGGALIAVAVLFKPTCALLAPFLAARRRWRALAGFLGCALALLALDLAVDGPARLRGYLTRELPRIARHGEGGTREMRLPARRVEELLAGVRPGFTRIDGRDYRPAYFRFVLNASLVPSAAGRLLQRAGRALGLEPTIAQLSLLLLAAGLALVLAGERRWGPVPRDGPLDAIYWQTALVLLLLCAPVSWAMGVVWLLPIVPLLLGERSRGSGATLALAACAAGLLVAGAPDPWDNRMVSPFGERSLDAKYLVAELLCLGGLLGLWSGGRAPGGAAPPPPRRTSPFAGRVDRGADRP